jgi:hypothetical protein
MTAQNIRTTLDCVLFTSYFVTVGADPTMQGRLIGLLAYNLFCWPCISKYECNESNLMHQLSSVYSVTTPLHVSGLIVANHQEIAIYMYMWQLVSVVFLSPLSADLDGPPTICHICTLLPPDDGLLASPKHVQEWWLNKLKINSASSWFHYTLTYITLANVWRKEVVA